MHMGNELLTLPVAGALFAGAAGGLGYASAKARKGLDEKKVPLLGVLGAFVFAAQMVNFPVLPGTSGHFVGATLLAVVLGPHAAALGMAAIVIVQCLVFQDGGLLALGANLVNMALVGPYVAHAIFSAISGGGRDVSRARFYAASFLAALGSVLAGAILVPIEVSVSGVSAAPFLFFLGVMAGVHAVIGAAEGAITFAVLAALARLRPDLVPVLRDERRGAPLGAALASVLAAAALVGGFLSLAASELPDGLDSTLERLEVLKPAGEEPARSAADAAERIGEKIAIFPDYSRPGGGWYWTTVSGILGAALVLGVASAAARALRTGRPRADAASAGGRPDPPPGPA